MIVVVEGPSAAGKTTWVRRHADDGIVPDPPPRPGPVAAAEWAALDAGRWQEALAAEARHGIAVCDTDPFKLHYAWGRWRIGEGDGEAFLAEAAACRAEFAAGRLGLADVVLCAIPDAAELAARKSGDRTRARHRFGVHSRLGDSLREWYEAADALDPGRVVWEHPVEWLAVLSGLRPRPERSGAELFDALLAGLPARP